MVYLFKPTVGKLILAHGKKTEKVIKTKRRIQHALKKWTVQEPMKSDVRQEESKRIEIHRDYVEKLTGQCCCIVFLFIRGQKLWDNPHIY